MFICDRLASSTGQRYHPSLLSMAPYRMEARSAARVSNADSPPSASIQRRTLPIT